MGAVRIGIARCAFTGLGVYRLSPKCRASDRNYSIFKDQRRGKSDRIMLSLRSPWSRNAASVWVPNTDPDQFCKSVSLFGNTEERMTTWWCTAHKRPLWKVLHLHHPFSLPSTPRMSLWVVSRSHLRIWLICLPSHYINTVLVQIGPQISLYFQLFTKSSKSWWFFLSIHHSVP